MHKVTKSLSEQLYWKAIIRKAIWYIPEWKINISKSSKKCTTNVETPKENSESLELSLKRKIRGFETLLQVYIHILQFDLLRDLRKNLSYLRKVYRKSFPASKKGEYFIGLKAFLSLEDFSSKQYLFTDSVSDNLWT